MDDDTADDTRANGRLVRPYLMTGGRTAVDEEIRLETQLQSTSHGLETGSHRWESAQILKLAERPIALVEISARLDIPLGVTRVLVSDLIKSKAISAQRPITTMSHKSHASLLEKVLDGVRSL
ncbi:MAG: DUF742 domain-containing protein [Ilumatobacter sp.]